MNNNTIDLLLFDSTYREKCIYDHTSQKDFIKNNNYNILTENQLQQLFQHYLIQKNSPNKLNQEYQHPLNLWMNIDCNQKEFFKVIQLILAINKIIPIIINKPHRIYWNGNIYKLKNKDNYYCINRDKGCTKGIIYNRKHQNYYINPHQQHSCNCEFTKYKQDLIFTLLKLELYNNIEYNKLNTVITVRDHYNNLIRKYDNKFPDFNLNKFCSFQSIKSSLCKKKFIIKKSLASNMQQYFNQCFSHALSIFCNSTTNRIQLEKNILVELKQNCCIISHVKLLQILYNGICIGSDGTFSIRPKFKNGNKFVKIHKQIYKIYSMHEYKTNGMDENLPIIKSYFVAICFLTSKQEEQYRWVYNTLLRWGTTYDYLDNCSIKWSICDYEIAQRNAIRDTINKKISTNIIGEEFHYTHAVLKKISRLGLKIFYVRKTTKTKFDPKFRLLIERFFTLAHIPTSKVKSIAIQLCIELYNYVQNNDKYDNNNKKSVKEFIIYYLKTWIQMKYTEIQSNCKFRGRCSSKTKNNISGYPIKEWNVSDNCIRTTNAVEVNNLHHRRKVGYFPTIDDFMQWYLNCITENIRNYNNDQNKEIMAKGSISNKMRNKMNLLKEYKNKTWSYKLFCRFSHKLSEIRFFNKRNRQMDYSDIDTSDIDNDDNTSMYTAELNCSHNKNNTGINMNFNNDIEDDDNSENDVDMNQLNYNTDSQNEMDL